MTGADWTFSIDRGGTFTDVVARTMNGGERVLKLLSEAPGQYDDAASEAIRSFSSALTMSRASTPTDAASGCRWRCRPR